MRRPSPSVGPLMLCLAALLGCLPAPAATELYVAPDGRDTYPGTLGRPFATIERARDALRELRAAGRLDGPATISVRGGVYAPAQTLRLEARDSGTPEAPVLLRAFGNERPVLTGGVAVRGFAPAEGQVLRADLAARGLKGLRFRQLFLGARRLVLARFPNADPANPITGGWAYVERAAPGAGTQWDATTAGRRTLCYAATDARQWSDPTTGQVCIFPSFEWWNNFVPIASVDPAARTIALARDCSYRISPGDRYYVMGLREELDAPGEWWLDGKADTLYLWPPQPLGGKVVTAPALQTILHLDGTQYLTVQGLQLQVCDGTAVRIDNAEHCRLVACTVTNAGEYSGSGIAVSGGRDTGVVGCDVSEIGQHGISLGGGDLVTRTPAGNYAENNHIWHTGVFYKQGTGIVVSGVGNRVSRNTIHDLPRFAIMAGGADHVLELNHLYRLCEETTDTGAIYCGATDWRSTHGFVIRYNFIHDVIGRGRVNGQWRAPYFAFGIYLDWSAMGTHTYGNIITRVPRAGLHLHDGRDNLIENNIIYECGEQQVEFNGWTTDHFFWKRGLEVLGWQEQYEAVAGQAAWTRPGGTLRDPRLAPLPDGRTMHSNRLRRNILVPGASDALAVRYRNVSLAHNPCDENLVWAGGRLVRTGQFAVKTTVGANLVPDGGFEAAEGAALPAGWTCRLPLPASRAETVPAPAHEGRRAVRLLGVDAPELEGRPAWERQVMLESRHLAGLAPGRAYRLSLWLKAGLPAAGEADPPAHLPVTLEALCYKAGAWDVRFTQQAQVASEWSRHEVAFRFPRPGDSNWHEGLAETCYVRVSIRDDAGELWVDDVDLREVELLSEWEAWQAQGMDRHSLVADPLFVDAGRDDYRLRPESPAFRLGFEAIPLERIGCYQGQERASWPLKG